jgi:glycosyltransferase involved in cell wall biosynthesis
MSISIFIQTLNEEENLPHCLESVAFSDDVVVLDSLSTDRTEELARAAGARFLQRKYDGRAANQNWAVENIRFKHPWVYYSDADEVVTPELRDELRRVVAADPREVCFRLRFKNMFMGKWIRWSSLYPTWVPRLFRPEKIRWEREANPVALVDGETGYLKEHFLHFTFNKGLAAWVDKHNAYSSREAAECLKSCQNQNFRLMKLLSKEPAARRRALKELSFHLPCRPALRFLYMYLLRGGFLDGSAGYHYCRLLTFYEYLIVLKIKEFHRRKAGLPM